MCSSDLYADALKQLVVGKRFREHVAKPAFQKVLFRVKRRVCSACNYSRFCSAVEFADFMTCLETTDARHGKIKQNHVKQEVACQCDCNLTAVGLFDLRLAGALQHPADHQAQIIVIVDNQYFEVVSIWS